MTQALSFQSERAARNVLSSDHASLVIGGVIEDPLISIVLPSMLQLGSVALLIVIMAGCPVAA